MMSKSYFLLLLLVGLCMGAMYGQRTDPNSTPPGAPIFEHPLPEEAHRAAPHHPGNAGERVAASNFTIIESQSFNSGHQMDLVWSGVISGMGHTPTIAPQSTLNSNAFFAGTNVLIVSSGVIGLSAAQVTIIQQFMQTGKSVYIQGEYLPSYATNIGFGTIVNATGGSFATGGTVSGSLVPTNVMNLYATSPNAVAPLGYHWYGCTASGCNNIEYFMNYAGNNIGWVYCPTNGALGDMVQSSDQDWVNQSISLPLMRNIAFALLSGNACSVVCGILNAASITLEAEPTDDGTVKLSWSADGDLQGGHFEIIANGKVVDQMPATAFAGEVLEWTDPTLPSGRMDYAVQYWDANGLATLRGETTLLLSNPQPRLHVANAASGFQVWLTAGIDAKELYLVDATGRRTPISTENVHAIAGQSIDMTGMAPGIYGIAGQTRDGQSLQTKAIWMH